MNSSESIISYSETMCSLVGVFRSLNYLQHLSSASLLGQAVQKLPPNMKEAWSMHTVKRTLDRPTLIDFIDWLRDKAEAHERMKYASLKPKTEDNTNTTTTKTKTVSNVFASIASSSQQSSNSKGKIEKKCQTALPVKTSILCGDVKFSGKRHPQREQNLWLTTSFVFHVSTPITRIDSVLSPVIVQKRHVEAHTTHFFTVPSGFSQRILSVATKRNPKHLVALAQ